tara:strand:- start:1264 stop:2550 length:1287 start_codon:yes stop_codon:yes gene_type:complete
MMKKIFYFITFFFIILFIIIKYNFLNISEIIFQNLPIKSKVIVRTLKKNDNNFWSITNNLFNDYNEKFIPETQQINLKVKRKKLIFNESFEIDKPKIEFIVKKKDSQMTHFFSYFFDDTDNQLVISDYIGNIYFFDKKKLFSNTDEIILNKKKTNLQLDKVLDILIVDNYLYVSHGNLKENSCYNWNISRALISGEELEFDNIYSSKECSVQNFYQPYGGRIQKFSINDENGLLITIGQNNPIKVKDNSIIGKILFIGFDNKEPKIISSGHRNTQGLWTDGTTILSTEHGPRGGDEINNIKINKNYGWPEASYGEPYGPKNTEPKFAKDHFNFGYQEPIFTFLKAIGISELIKLPNSFSNFWQNNFLVSSLWGHSLFRIKLDKKFEKLIFYEKIYIGQRIRDIMYLKEENAILVALEEKGEIGIITKN